MSKPVAILSVDMNPEYLFCIPIVAKSWELQNFDIALRIISKDPEYDRSRVEFIVGYITNMRSCEILRERVTSISNDKLESQLIRLYYFLHDDNISDDTYCILGDADMFIASSFLYRDFDKVNSFGHDLTGFGQIPMCYVGMTKKKWKEVMNWIVGDEETMKYDLLCYADKDNSDWYKSWGADQDILTAKLKNYGFDKVYFIMRGNDSRNSGLPFGRWDRYNWQKPTGEIHDCHLPRDPMGANWNKIVEMCYDIYPLADWSWLDEYHEKFLKL